MRDIFPISNVSLSPPPPSGPLHEPTGKKEEEIQFRFGKIALGDEEGPKQQARPP